MKINFITSNQGKVSSLRRNFESINAPIEINPTKLDIVEPQCNSVKEVSISKARQAYEMLKEPVLVEDGGFCIMALNDFPGVYTRYALDTIGAEGLLSLMHNHDDRRCYFTSVSTYIDENGNSYSFERDHDYGLLRREMDDVDCPHAWSDLWYIYEVTGFGKTLAALSKKELGEYYSKSDKKDKNKGSLDKFTEWYMNHIIKPNNT